jgi:quinol-cytochrome oxidoreductase complex cytochrome b subunit
VAGTNLIKSIPLIGPGLYGAVMGGSEPGPATLLRFYSWHIFGLTLLIVVVGIWHIFRVRRDGGVAVPPPELRRDLARITRFELARREALAAILATVVLLLLSIFFPAPLASPLEETSSLAADARAPWFFLWVQQLLKLGDAFLLGVLIPLGVVVALIWIPYLLPSARPAELGRWFPRGNRLAQIVVLVLVLAILVLTIFALLPSTTFNP